MSDDNKTCITLPATGDNDAHDECSLALERALCVANMLQSNLDESTDEFVVADSLVRQIKEADAWFTLVQKEILAQRPEVNS